MIKLILKLLMRAIKVGIKLDSSVLTDFKCLPENYIIKITVLPNNISVAAVCKNNDIIVLKEIPETADLLVEFKDEKSAINCLLGKCSLATAFCEHRIKIYGNINNAMAVTRIVNTIETYLFPKFITNKLFTPLPQLETNKCKFYINLLFGGK